MAKKAESTTDSKIVMAPIEIEVSRIGVHALPSSTYIPQRCNSGFEGGGPKQKNRDLEALYEACFYVNEAGEYCVPARAFMGAMLDASIAILDKGTPLKRSVRVMGDLYPLDYDDINKRVDFPRRSGKTGAPYECHRPEFLGWSCEVVLQYDLSLISAREVINLLNRAGWCSGIGAWRPSSPKGPGTHGMFQVDPDYKIETIRLE